MLELVLPISEPVKSIGEGASAAEAVIASKDLSAALLCCRSALRFDDSQLLTLFV
jgi:hypothetical protein